MWEWALLVDTGGCVMSAAIMWLKVEITFGSRLKMSLCVSVQVDWKSNMKYLNMFYFMSLFHIIHCADWQRISSMFIMRNSCERSFYRKPRAVCLVTLTTKKRLRPILVWNTVKAKCTAVIAHIVSHSNVVVTALHKPWFAHFDRNSIDSVNMWNTFATSHFSWVFKTTKQGANRDL